MNVVASPSPPLPAADRHRPWTGRLERRFYGWAAPLPGPIVRHFTRNLVNDAASSCPPRPHAWSLWGTAAVPAGQPTGLGLAEDHVAWPGLVDRSYTARHLGPDDEGGRPRPGEDEVWALFARGKTMLPGRSSALFVLFAQWFTDSFLRTLGTDRRRTDSNHEIDLCQLYGLDEPTGRALRELSNATGRRGRLKSRPIKVDGAVEDFPPLIYADGKIDPAFYDLCYLRQRCSPVGDSCKPEDRRTEWENGLRQVFGPSNPDNPIDNAARRDHLYALGLDRGNSTIVYSALNTLFLREHNWLAAQIERSEPGWDDERVFQTARLVNIRQVLQIVVEDYIGHIGGTPLRFDRAFAERQPWYRTNRTSLEFNLLYRWHSMVPDHLLLGGKPLPHADYRYNNALLEQHGLAAVLTAAAQTRGGRAGLCNTPHFLEHAERAGLAMARTYRLQSLNAYRDRFKLDRYKSFEALVGGDRAMASHLGQLYRDVDDVEYTVGLFAEWRYDDDVFPETLRTMVGYDAFTHILTNPVLSTEVHRRETLGKWGMDYIEECDRHQGMLGDIAARHVPGAAVSFG